MLKFASITFTSTSLIYWAVSKVDFYFLFKMDGARWPTLIDEYPEIYKHASNLIADFKAFDTMSQPLTPIPFRGNYLTCYSRNTENSVAGSEYGRQWSNPSSTQSPDLPLTLLKRPYDRLLSPQSSTIRLSSRSAYLRDTEASEVPG